MSCSTASLSSPEITEEHAKWFDLNLNRELLDPNFNGYKLSLDTFPQYKLDLTQHDLDTYNFSDADNNTDSHKMLLFQHLKLIGLQNLIVVNQFNDADIYYFDSKFRLVRIAYQGSETRAIVPTNLQLNLSKSSANRVNVTMKFVNANTAAVFDGYETIYLFTSNAKDQWTELFQFSTKNLEKFGVACILKDAILLENNQLHLLFMNVQEKMDDTHSTGAFDTLINWLLFEPASDNVWSMKRLRRLNCANSVPDYVALETNGASVFLAGVDTIRFEFDSVKPVKPLVSKQAKKREEVDSQEMEAESVEKFYTWNQTATEVNMSVCILEPGDLVKSDLEIKINKDTLELLHKGNVVIRDSFFGLVKSDESTWTLNASGHSIEFVLTKASVEIWPCCLKDMNKYGEYKEDEARESMDTSEKKITWEETQSLFRMEQQLEECDEINDEPGGANGDNDKMLMLRRMDGELHCATHKTYINDNKFLFDVRLSACKSPALCLRHDVDGILWQPHRITDTANTSTVWLTHIHTFLAFGYVQASKTNTKFRSCATNLSYACIADINKHLYVYRSVPADTQLKNRSTGKLINQIAKQYLISLDTDDEIYGLYCANNFIVVLSSTSCYVYQINSN